MGRSFEAIGKAAELYSKIPRQSVIVRGTYSDSSSSQLLNVASVWQS